MEAPLGQSQQQPSAPLTSPGQGRLSPHARASEELRAVLAISQALTGKLHLEHVLAVAVGAVADIAGAEGSSLLLIDPQTGGMSFHVASGAGATAVKTIELPPGAGICGHVARTGEPIIVNDAQNDPRLYRQVDQTTGITTRNLLCVPLVSGDTLWGVLEILNKSDGADFDESDLVVAETIASQIALALANSRLHEEIVDAERMAAVGRTVSGLAHCVKNILNGIRSGSVVIDRHLKASDLAKVTDGWQVVRKHNEMLSALVLDMLSLARDTKFHPFPTDVNDLAEQICTLNRDRAAERDIEVAFSPAADFPEATTDMTQLYRCLLNLVSNAVEACDEGGRVNMRVCRGAGRQRFTVSITDNGPGISPANQRKLFTEFFTTKGNRGTGLGLPVTRKLVHGMGGTIKFHSTPGKGAKFVIALPIDGAPPKQEENT